MPTNNNDKVVNELLPCTFHLQTLWCDWWEMKRRKKIATFSRMY